MQFLFTIVYSRLNFKYFLKLLNNFAIIACLFVSLVPLVLSISIAIKLSRAAKISMFAAILVLIFYLWCNPSLLIIQAVQKKCLWYFAKIVLVVANIVKAMFPLIVSNNRTSTTVNRSVIKSLLPMAISAMGFIKYLFNKHYLNNILY